MWRSMMMGRRWTVLLMVVGLTVALGWGCDREEYDPEAVPAQEADDESEADDPAHAAGINWDSHHYSMQLSEREIAAGEDEEVGLELLPGTDLRVNLDFPWSIEFEETDGIELGASSLDGDAMELTEERAVIPVELMAEAQGEHTVAARGNFSVCNDDICHILRDESVEFVVDATETNK